jgi:hypothetical protein
MSATENEADIDGMRLLLGIEGELRGGPPVSVAHG